MTLKSRPRSWGRRRLWAALLPAVALAALPCALTVAPAGAVQRSTAIDGASPTPSGVTARTDDTSASASHAAAQAISVTTPPAGTLSPGKKLTVRGRITDRGASALDHPVLMLSVRRAALTTQAQVRAWAVGTATRASDTTVVKKIALGAALAPGTGRKFSLSVPAAAFGLSTFGPRGLVLTLVERDGTGERTVASLSTVVVWSPEGSRGTVSLTVVAPLVTTVPAVHADSPTSAQEAELDDGGRLSDVLDAGGDLPITWLLDPSLATAADAAATRADDETPAADATATADTGTVAGTESDAADTTLGAASAAWWLRVRGSTVAHDVALLPWGDPSLAAVGRNGGRQTLNEAVALARGASSTLLSTTSAPVVLWPTAGSLTPSASRVATDATGASLLADDSSLTVDGAAASSTTRTAVSVANGRAGRSVVLVDAAASDDLATATTTAGWRAERLVLADIALHHHGAGALLVLPRGWSPSPAAAQRVLSALYRARWVQPVSLASRLTVRATSIASAAGHGQAGSEPASSQVRRVVATDSSLAVLLSALTRPQLYQASVRGVGFELLSTRWAGHISLGAAATNLWAASAGEVLSAVTATPGGPKVLGARTAKFPVTITNKLSTSVTVQVSLHPRTGRVVAPTVRTVTLGPRSNRQVNIPVRAVADGAVEVSVMLRTVDGSLLQESGTAVVTVHRDWESNLIIGAGGVLTLLLVVGLVRSARRDRVRVPAEAVVDPEDDVARRDDDRRRAKA